MISNYKPLSLIIYYLTYIISENTVFNQNLNKKLEVSIFKWITLYSVYFP